MTMLNESQLMVLEKGVITCADVTEMLGDYVDQELCSSLKARLDAHIQSCPACQENQSTYALTVKLAGELEPKPVTIAIQNRLREALNRRLGLKLPLHI